MTREFQMTGGGVTGGLLCGAYLERLFEERRQQKMPHVHAAETQLQALLWPASQQAANDPANK